MAQHSIYSGNVPLPIFQDEVHTCRVLSYGDCIVPGVYSVHSQFRRASNFRCGANLVSLVDSTVGSGPLNIVVDKFSGIAADRLVIHSDYFEMGNQLFVFDDALLYDSAIEFPSIIDPQTLQENLRVCKEIVNKLAPTKSLSFLFDESRQTPSISTFDGMVRDRFIKGTSMIADGSIIPGIFLLKGLGVGLTPSGDDFIAGLLFALNIQQTMLRQNLKILIDDIFSAALSSNLLSLASLWNAKEGRVFEKLKRMIASLFNSDREDLETGITDLLTVGATSGADIAVGLIIGLEGSFQ